MLPVVQFDIAPGSVSFHHPLDPDPGEYGTFLDERKH
jgi:hypothetical protein